MRTYLIALLLFLGGAELTLRLIKPASYYPDSYSRIWGLYEKKRHMYGGIPYYLRHFTFIRKELPPPSLP